MAVEFIVTVDPEADVVTLVPPTIFILFAEGVAVPESAVNVVGTVAPAEIVGLPATPSPSATDIPDPAVIVLVVQVLVPVLTATPVVDRASKAARSFANANVGLPDTPSLLLIVIPAAG